MSSVFKFYGARVLRAPELMFRFVEGRPLEVTPVWLEVVLPAAGAGVAEPKRSVVEVEAWGKLARVARDLPEGVRVDAEGVVMGSCWKDRQGAERCTVHLRLRGVRVLPMVPVQGELFGGANF